MKSFIAVLGLSIPTAVAMGCATEMSPYDVSADLWVSPDDVGPRVVFDPLHLPNSDTPFPNDLGLRPSATTASGLAVNVSTERPSKHHKHLREQFNGLDGFGTTGPAWVRFDHPIDLSTVNDDSVILVNIEPGHPRFGERVPLDLARNLLPTRAEEAAFYGMDPERGSHDLLFASTNEADTDGDGVPERVSHYEVATHTLILHPLRPLAPGARHAVLITRKVHGWIADASGTRQRLPVRSAFRFKAHLGQIQWIRQAIKAVGMSGEELAFGWTYTTGDPMRPIKALREGLYGRGVLAMMRDFVEDQVAEIRDSGVTHDADGLQFPADDRDTPYLVQGEFLGELLGLILSAQGSGDAELSSFDHVDYAVFGSFKSPDLRVSERRDFDLNTYTGDGSMVANQVPFVLWVPKTTERYKPPFQLLFYFHGTGTSRMESMAVANTLARQGIATIAFDEVGHGPLIPNLIQLRDTNPDSAALIELLPSLLAGLMVPERSAEIGSLPFDQAVAELEKIGLYRELGVVGRNEDENGDGILEPAEAFYFADPFRMCASFWQDTVDFMALVALMRGLDPSGVPKEPLANPGAASYSELEPYFRAGDFNADGIVDTGGPGVAFGTAGTSLGGIHAVMAAAVEPEVTTSTPIVAGGGLAMVMLRSGLRNVTERILLDAFGTVIVGCPDNNGMLYLSQGNDAEECRRPGQNAFGEAKVPAEATVWVENLVNGLVIETTLNNEGGFVANIESDKGDAIRVTVSIVTGEVQSFETVSQWEGSGYTRGTPEFRRAVGVLQHALDRCDPSAFAPYLFLNPPEGQTPTNVLMLSAIGDSTVPVASAVHLAAATGLLGQGDAMLERWAALRDAGVLDNARVDVDDLLGDNAPDVPTLGPAPAIAVGAGKSALRFADADGNHTYIAGYDKEGFDWGRYHRNLMALYHRCGGRVMPDEAAECLEDSACPLLDAPETIPGCETP